MKTGDMDKIKLIQGLTCATEAFSNIIIIIFFYGNDKNNFIIIYYTNKAIEL